MSNLREIADWMTGRSGEAVALVGWSEGAALGVLGAAADENKKTFAGLITFGLGDENVIGLPFLMIQSAHDQYTPLDEAKRLFNLAHEPKKFVLVPAENHRFDGDQPQFFLELRQGLAWMDQVRSTLSREPAPKPPAARRK